MVVADWLLAAAVVWVERPDCCEVDAVAPTAAPFPFPWVHYR